MEETFSFQNDLSDSENERDLMMNQAPIEQISTVCFSFYNYYVVCLF